MMLALNPHRGCVRSPDGARVSKGSPWPMRGGPAFHEEHHWGMVDELLQSLLQRRRGLWHRSGLKLLQAIFFRKFLEVRGVDRLGFN